jgi:hypothetical protein
MVHSSDLRMNTEEQIMDWEIYAMILLGGAALVGIVSVWDQYRRLRDLRALRDE